MRATSSDASGSGRPVSLAVTAAALALSVAVLGGCRGSTERPPLGCTFEHDELSPRAVPIITERCVLPGVHIPREPHYRYGLRTTETADRRFHEGASSLVSAPAAANGRGATLIG